MTFNAQDVARFNKAAAADPAERVRWVEWANSYLRFVGSDRGEAVRYANKKIAGERRKQGRHRNPLDGDLHGLLRAAATGNADAARRYYEAVRRVVGGLSLEVASGLYDQSARVRERLSATRTEGMGYVARANLELIARIEALGGGTRQNPDDEIRFLERELAAGVGALDRIAAQLYRAHRRLGVESNLAMQAASDAVIAALPAGDRRDVVRAVLRAYGKDCVRERFSEVLQSDVNALRQTPDDWVLWRVWESSAPVGERNDSAARSALFRQEQEVLETIDDLGVEIEQRAGMRRRPLGPWVQVEGEDLRAGAVFWNLAESRAVEVLHLEDPGRAWVIDARGYTIITAERVADGMRASGWTSERATDVAALNEQARFLRTAAWGLADLRSSWIRRLALLGVSYALRSPEVQAGSRTAAGVVVAAGTPRAEPASLASFEQALRVRPIVTDDPLRAIWAVLAGLGIQPQSA